MRRLKQSIFMKSVAVIESCNTVLQLQVADKYVDTAMRNGFICITGWKALFSLSGVRFKKLMKIKRLNCHE